MEWIINHWQWLVLGAGIAVSVINAATKHFSEHKGFVKVALFFVELVSILTSYGEINGRLGKFKAPMQSVKK